MSAKSEGVLEKRCTNCREVKPASAFWRHKRNGDGLETQCKECRNRERKLKTIEQRTGGNLGPDPLVNRRWEEIHPDEPLGWHNREHSPVIGDFIEGPLWTVDHEEEEGDNAPILVIRNPYGVSGGVPFDWRHAGEDRPDLGLRILYTVDVREMVAEKWVDEWADSLFPSWGIKTVRIEYLGWEDGRGGIYEYRCCRVHGSDEWEVLRSDAPLQGIQTVVNEQPESHGSPRQGHGTNP